jgi:hypothetical protein
MLRCAYFRESKEISFLIFYVFTYLMNRMRLLDRLCCLVVRVPGYRSSGPGSIPGATRSSEK